MTSSLSEETVTAFCSICNNGTGIAIINGSGSGIGSSTGSGIGCSNFGSG